MPVASERSLCGNHSAMVLMAAGKLPGLADTEAKARNAEFKSGVGQRVAHGGKAPDAHDQDVADARADLVDHSAGHEQADGVGSLKGIHDIAVVDLRQADGVLERGLEQRDDLSVHVIDRGREEEHGADGPAHIP